MKITKSISRTYKYINPLIASNILYLNWLAEKRKEAQQNNKKVRDNGKK